MSDSPDEIETVYGYFLCRFAEVSRAGDTALKERVYSAIGVFEELWPKETGKWRDRFTGTR
jgi:hypothetical protein